MGQLILRFFCLGALLATICFGATSAQEAKKSEPEKKDAPKKEEPPKDPIVEGRPLSVWINQLKDPDPKVREQSASIVAKQRSKASMATATALEMLKDSKDVYNRQLGAYLLKYIKPEAKQVIPLLVEALKDDDSQVRREASVALSMLGTKGAPAAPALVQLLKHKTVETRQLAAFVLGNINPELQIALAPLRAVAANDTSEFVRNAAKEALKKIDPASAGVQ